MAWGKLSSNSITVAGDTLTGDSFTTSKFIQYLGHLIPETSNNTEMFIRPNNNSNTVYANRKSVNGGTDVTAVSQTEINSNGDNVPTFQVIYFINILGEEKLGIHFETSAQETGAGTAPSRREQVDKFVPSPDVDITSFTGINTRASANLGVDTNISALGTDITPAAAIPFAENAQVGSRAEITDTRKMYHFVAGNTPTYETDFTTNTGWVEADSGKIGVDTSTERLDFNILRDGSNDKAYYDLGSALSDTAWVMRFKCTMTAQNYTSSSNKIGSFGMSSVTGSATTTQDFLGLYKASNGDNASVVVDGSILGPSTGSSLGRPAAGTIRYHEMKRTSATSWTNSIYSTSDYSGTPDATHTLTIASSIIGLRYFNITNWIGTGGVGNVAGYIDDVTIYDGVTSVQVGNAWSEEGT